METLKLTMSEKIFINSYIQAIYFTETGGTGQPDSDDPLDSDFERECIIDCLYFYSCAWAYLSTDTAEIEQAGHDFWLTRNGHGSGFWDRDWPEDKKEMLMKITSRLGHADAYFDN